MISYILFVDVRLVKECDEGMMMMMMIIMMMMMMMMMMTTD